MSPNVPLGKERLKKAAPGQAELKAMRVTGQNQVSACGRGVVEGLRAVAQQHGEGIARRGTDGLSTELRSCS